MKMMKKKELEQLKAIKERMEFVMESMFHQCNNTMGLENDIEILEKIIKENEKKA
jgi:hypothetical protein